MQELVRLSGTDMRLMVASVRDPSEIAHLSAHVRGSTPLEGRMTQMARIPKVPTCLSHVCLTVCPSASPCVLL